MSLIKSKSFESTLNSEQEKNDVLYLGDRAEPGKGGSGGASLSNNNRSSGKLSIRRRRKNHNRSSSDVE
jgi:hypothetical protein